MVPFELGSGLLSQPHCRSHAQYILPKLLVSIWTTARVTAAAVALEEC